MACHLFSTKPLSEPMPGILLIGHLGNNFNEILIKIYTFSFKKMHLKMSSGKWRPFCLSLNVLINNNNQEVKNTGCVCQLWVHTDKCHFLHHRVLFLHHRVFLTVVKGPIAKTQMGCQSSNLPATFMCSMTVLLYISHKMWFKWHYCHCIWWLLMSWCLFGTRTSATIMMMRAFSTHQKFPDQISSTDVTSCDINR